MKHLENKSKITFVVDQVAAEWLVSYQDAFLTPIKRTTRRKSTENDTRHPKQLVYGTRAALVNMHRFLTLPKELFLGNLDKL